MVKDEVQAVQKKQEDTKEEVHELALSNEDKTKLSELRIKLASTQNPADQSLVYKDIAELYFAASAFDSSGYYFEKIALLDGSKENWIFAGDAYFQGYNLNLDPSKTQKSLEKCRYCYNKVLSIESNNLHAKTNLAMTFVKTDSPMKAITMLREVLDTNPNYVPAIMSLGGLSMQSNQFDKAVGRFNYVLKIDPTNINAKLGLAYSLIELKKTNQAKTIFNEVLKEDIDKVLKDEITKTLNSLK